MTDTDIKTLDAPALQALVDQLKAESADHYEKYNEVRNRLNKAESRLTFLTSPYWEGDIIEDELGVRYRVTRVHANGSANGIRLNDKGVEAHKDSRTIWSKKLTRVDVETE